MKFIKKHFNSCLFLLILGASAISFEAKAQGSTFPCDGPGMVMSDNICGTSTNGVFTPLRPQDYTTYYQNNPSVQQGTSPNCNAQGEGYVDGVCRILYSSVDATQKFEPKRIKIGSGPTAYYLDPTTQYSNWHNCGTGVGVQDSTCVVPYRYGVAAGLATITASFSRTSPMVGGVGTSPRWTTANAISLTVNCAGVATYANANAPLQANPSGIVFNSAVAGPVTCVLTAMNSDNEPTTATITANFIPPIAPTIQAGFSRPNFEVGTGGTYINWASQNARTVYVSCPNYNWGPGYVGLQGNPSNVRMDRGSAGPINCNFTATNEVGQTATASAAAFVSNPPPPPPPAPPTVSAFFTPSNYIEQGNRAQIVINSANAESVALSCAGHWPAFGPIPPNTTYYGDNHLFNYSGRTSCVITAQNAIGEVATAYADIAVWQMDTEGGQAVTCNPSHLCPAAGSPSLPPPSGGNINGTNVRRGYADPVTGQVYSDPEGTIPCDSCVPTDGADGTPLYTNGSETNGDSIPSSEPTYGGEGE